ncbi:MAG TPA: hypothetical protein VGM90_09165 [Kofleriaceae bacterium]|jgi:hypothetical protein
MITFGRRVSFVPLVVLALIAGSAEAAPFWKINAPLDGYQDTSMAARAKMSAGALQVVAMHGQVDVTAYSNGSTVLSLVQTTLPHGGSPNAISAFESGTTEEVTALGTQTSIKRTPSDWTSVIDQEFQRGDKTILVHRVTGVDRTNIISLMAFCTGEKVTCASLLDSISVDASRLVSITEALQGPVASTPEQKDPAYTVGRIIGMLVIGGIVVALVARSK